MHGRELNRRTRRAGLVRRGDNVPCGNEDVKRLLDVGGLVGASEITMRAVWVMLVVICGELVVGRGALVGASSASHRTGGSFTPSDIMPIPLDRSSPSEHIYSAVYI